MTSVSPIQGSSSVSASSVVPCHEVQVCATWLSKAVIQFIQTAHSQRKADRDCRQNNLTLPNYVLVCKQVWSNQHELHVGYGWNVGDPFNPAFPEKFRWRGNFSPIGEPCRIYLATRVSDHRIDWRCDELRRKVFRFCREESSQTPNYSQWSSSPPLVSKGVTVCPITPPGEKNGSIVQIWAVTSISFVPLAKELAPNYGLIETLQPLIYRKIAMFEGKVDAIRKAWNATFPNPPEAKEVAIAEEEMVEWQEVPEEHGHVEGNLPSDRMTGHVALEAIERMRRAFANFKPEIGEGGSCSVELVTTDYEAGGFSPSLIVDSEETGKSWRIVSNAMAPPIEGNYPADIQERIHAFAEKQSVEGLQVSWGAFGSSGLFSYRIVRHLNPNKIDAEKLDRELRHMDRHQNFVFKLDPVTPFEKKD